jgi:gluconate 5-dehydrogenase
MSSDIFDLSGSVALVTGSSQGLGLVMARGLGRAGAKIVLNGRDKRKLEAAVERLSAEGVGCTGEAFDVTDSSAVARAVESIRERIGPMNVLVNNAGIHRRAPLEKLSDEQWQEVIDVNLTGAFRVARAVAADMIERRRGKIINVCSLMSEMARPTTGAYAAAKGGLKMLTRAMAVEWARHNIQVNGLAPGYFITPMTEALAADADFDRWLKARTPAGRWGNVDELVGPLVFLASEASSFVNGQVLYVDGGILAAL